MSTPQPLSLCLAPLRGVTTLLFRRCFTRHFGGFDLALSPFLTTVAGTRIKATHLADIAPEQNRDLPLVPQVIGKSPTQLRIILLAIRDLGYSRCDLNAGCPWPMIVKKGRGTGLLRDADVLRRMLDVACEIFPAGFSIKVRLGIDEPALLRQRMELLNTYPLQSVTVHARTARQRYEGEVNLPAFAEVLQACRHPVCYNGDIRTAADLKTLAQAFPKVSAWMIGRGAITDPLLPTRLRGQKCDAEIPRIRAFLDDYEAQTAAILCGPAPLMGRLKELWSYLHIRFEEGETLWRQIRTCRTPCAYREILSQWWQSNPRLAQIANGIKLKRET